MMGKLERELEELVGFVANGGGLGGQDAIEQHQREIDLIKFKITRRDNMRIAVISALTGALVAAAVTIALSLF